MFWSQESVRKDFDEKKARGETKDWDFEHFRHMKREKTGRTALRALEGRSLYPAKIRCRDGDPDSVQEFFSTKPDGYGNEWQWGNGNE